MSRYVVNTDITGTTSFIAGKDTRSKLVAGQAVFCVVSSISESGQLFLTPQLDEEATFTEIKNWKSVAMVHVRPDILFPYFSLFICIFFVYTV